MKTLIVHIIMTTCVARLSSVDGIVTLNRKKLFVAGQTTGEGTLHHVREKLTNLEETITELFTKIAETQRVCHKEGNSLKCCADDVFKNNVCVEFVLTLSNFTVKIVFDVNNTTIINEEISEQEPDPICGALPHLHIIKFCFEPYNLAYSGETLNVCLAVSGRMGPIEKDIARVDLNCFLFSKDGTISHVEPGTSATNTGIINFNAS